MRVIGALVVAVVVSGASGAALAQIMTVHSDRIRQPWGAHQVVPLQTGATRAAAVEVDRLRRQEILRHRTSRVDERVRVTMVVRRQMVRPGGITRRPWTAPVRAPILRETRRPSGPVAGPPSRGRLRVLTYRDVARRQRAVAPGRGPISAGTRTFPFRLIPPPR